MKQRPKVIEKTTDMYTMSSGIHKGIFEERNALNTHTTTTTATTRLWVTSSWYLRWRWIAKNLSTLIAITPNIEAIENVPLIKGYAMYVESEGMFCCNFLTSNAKLKGWTSKPTQRSETARLRSNVFKCFGNNEVFLIAWIVIIFNMMAVYDEKALSAQLAIYE